MAGSTLPSDTDNPKFRHSAASNQDGKARANGYPQVRLHSVGRRDHRDLCALALTDPAQSTPVAGRTGLATAEWVVVDRVDGRA